MQTNDSSCDLSKLLGDGLDLETSNMSSADEEVKIEKKKHFRNHMWQVSNKKYMKKFDKKAKGTVLIFGTGNIWRDGESGTFYNCDQMSGRAGARNHSAEKEARLEMNEKWVQQTFILDPPPPDEFLRNAIIALADRHFMQYMNAIFTNTVASGMSADSICSVMASNVLDDCLKLKTGDAEEEECQRHEAAQGMVDLQRSHGKSKYKTQRVHCLCCLKLM